MSLSKKIEIKQIYWVVYGKMEWDYTYLWYWIHDGCDLNAGLNVTSLECSNVGLSVLPPEICLLQNLEELYCHKNKLINLPANIGQLQNLRILNCSFNCLTELPQEIGLLQNLEELYCSKNNLNSLPPTIGLLQNLTHLFCAKNKLTVLPAEIGFLQNLEYLGCKENKLTFLPNTFMNLQNLKIFMIDKVRLRHLTPELGIFLNQKTNTNDFDETFIKNLNYNLRKNTLLFAESIKNENTVISVVFGNLLRPICEFI